MKDKDTRTLVSDPQYQGKYLAFVSFNDNSVVGVGKTRKEARKRANTKGHSEPLVLYAPFLHGARCINAHR